jgi:hypothetical protein
VKFNGTVEVCLDKCPGFRCENGQIAYGRRRRAINQTPVDSNKIYEISMTAFIKVNYDEGTDPSEYLVLKISDHSGKAAFECPK